MQESGVTSGGVLLSFRNFQSGICNDLTFSFSRPKMGLPLGPMCTWSLLFGITQFHRPEVKR